MLTKKTWRTWSERHNKESRPESAGEIGHGLPLPVIRPLTVSSLRTVIAAVIPARKTVRVTGVTMLLCTVA